MYNKSREKVAPKPPISKTSTALTRTTKANETTLPTIKPRKESASKLPSSISKITSKSSEATQKSSMKKIEVAPNKKNLVKEKVQNEKPSWDRLPLNLLLDVAEYACTVPFEIY